MNYYTEDLPWTAEEFKPGDRVTWTEKAVRFGIAKGARMALTGKVIKARVGPNGATWSVTVLWGTYRRSHTYAGSFITKVVRKRRTA